ncbi:MAG: ABC transporter permease [Candidatus Brocadiia bacterium]
MAKRKSIVDSSRDAGIGRQIVLPLRKSIEIAWKSIRIRIWRSLITTSGIVLAIAFLMSVWVSSGITATLQKVPEESPDYMVIQQALQQRAIAEQNITVRVGILQSTGEESTKQASLSALLRDSLQTRQAFRPLLINDLKSLQRALNPPEGEAAIGALVILSFPADLASKKSVDLLESFVQEGGTMLIVGGGQLWPDESPEEVKSKFASLLPAKTDQQTFEINPKAINSHDSMENVAWDQHPIASYIKATPKKNAQKMASMKQNGLLWMQPRGDGNVFWSAIQGEALAEPEIITWYQRSGIVPSSLQWGLRAQLRGGTMAKRNLWLVSLSLLVCIVGITNAMLMSVTERFREIGTMKCLGALDSFVVRLFLIESSFQGAVGSIAGAIIGLTLALVRGLFSFHVQDPATGKSYWLLIRHFPGTQILFWVGISVVVGVILSVVAAIYPAYRAAKMEPVEAMRTEA